MLEAVLQHLNNWFLVPDGIYTGEYTVQDGGITLSFLQPGQYFRVVGSVFNDGLHQYPAADLTDEVFAGAIWALAVPKAVVELSQSIADWNAKNGPPSPFASESFGGYSYTRQTNGKGGAAGWQSAFADQLAPYRKPAAFGFAQPAHQGVPPWR